jgi:hypothetical protein
MLDLAHDRFISNPGVPLWWPAFCLAYDLTAAAYLAWLLKMVAFVPQPREVGRTGLIDDERTA